jgi:hypothetical protein
MVSKQTHVRRGQNNHLKWSLGGESTASDWNIPVYQGSNRLNRKHFKKLVLGVAQRVAYEKLEVVDDGSNQLTRSKKVGFVKVENMGVQCSAKDKRVVNRLRYKRPFDSKPK